MHIQKFSPNLLMTSQKLVKLKYGFLVQWKAGLARTKKVAVFQFISNAKLSFNPCSLFLLLYLMEYDSL